MGETNSKVAFEICVVTVDFLGSSLGPGINMVMFDDKNNQSPVIALDHIFQNELDYHQAKFTIDLQPWSKPKAFGKLHHIEFWRTDGSSNSTADGDFNVAAWYLDRVIIRDRRFGLTGEWDYFFFPLHDWVVPAAQYVLQDCETFLPQQDPYPDLRHVQLDRRQQLLYFMQRASGLPVEIAEVPTTELFSYDSRWDIEDVVLELVDRVGLAVDYSSEESWDSLDSIGDLYKRHNITEPLSLSYWMMNDVAFGAQRLKGCNPFVIRLCTEFPSSMIYLKDWIVPHLEGWTLQQTLMARRLFYVDYSIMRGLHCRQGRMMAAPLCLFFYTEKRQLQPLAIHLDPLSGNDQLLFRCTDPAEEWLQAKLWFNLADSCHHMVVGRLLTHLILEGVYVSLRRNLAQSHPVYQLLAPHFRSFLAVNQKLKEWMLDRGWIARNIQLTRKGIKQLLRRGFKQWRFDIQANVYAELESRGVYDRKALGNYPYREDAFVVHAVMEKYVMRFLRVFYAQGPVALLEDAELQTWRNEMADPMEEAGLGLEGIPLGKARIRNGVVYPITNIAGISSHSNASSLSVASSGSSGECVFGLITLEETKSLLMGILHLLVIVSGSVLRLPMFDEYGFVAHYPLSLFGSFPLREDEEEVKRSTLESWSGLHSLSAYDKTVAALPNRRMTVEMVLYTRVASRIQLSNLGHYDINFIVDKRALAVLEEFQAELKAASEQIATNNRLRDLHHKYLALDPAVMPNYPGI
uniref:Arachidonate 5 lipoxygenase n=2 Tax=Echinococcus granulosus TaxID=6210 RepID=A0A068WST2_ECHGR|nr:arachidonate 5 lipoxygenase [Echinococcus granulosus]